MKIAVLVKQVPDTWGERRIDLSTGRVDRESGDLVIDEVGERALEAALVYKDQTKAEVTVITMGPESAREILRKGLAMGADSAIHISDDSLQGMDITGTCQVLASVLRRDGYDLIVAGNETTDGRGGVLPAMLAESLGIEHLTHLSSVDITETTVSGQRDIAAGPGIVAANLPAVISVTERAPEPRFPSFRGIMKAKKKPLENLRAEEVPEVKCALVSVNERPARTGGVKVVDDGTAVESLVDYLTTNKLI